MKTTFHFILIVLALLLTFACNDQDLSEEPAPFEPNDLSGKVVFQKISTSTLQTADVNFMNNSTSYDNALTYTRPVWSQDGTNFAALELKSPTETGNEAYVFVVKIVDTESGNTTIREIGSSLNLDLNGCLSWSPDGKTLAMLSTFFDRIIYLDIQTGDTIQTNFPGQTFGWITALDWHPDGDIAVSISLYQQYSHDIEIWMLEPFTTKLKNKIAANTITSSYAFEFMDWNTSGSKLLLSPSSFYNDIYLLDANTGEYTTIPNIKGQAPAWSPNGNYVMYTGISGVDGSTLIPGLFVSDLDGSFEKLLLTDAGYSDWY
nr:hypothetical protein [uncultured Draconibacterium sp.]